MRKGIFALALVAAACKSPVAPTPAPVAPVSVQVAAAPVCPALPDPVAPASTPAHNIEFSFVGSEGRTYFLCSTQPRTAWGSDGRATTEVDHYAQDAPCPAVPID